MNQMPATSLSPAPAGPPARPPLPHVPAYYLFTASALVLVPRARAARRLLAGGRLSALLDAAAGFGVAAALFQTLGFVRWTLAVPYLADVYADPRASAAAREAALVAQEVLNRYLGMSVGEHLGWVCNGVWVALHGAHLVRARDPLFRPWCGWLALVLGTLTVLSAAEQFGASGWRVTASFSGGYVGFVLAAGASGVHLLRGARRRAT
jgi:hypothetical protein